jgi:hypothetical protein
MVQKQGLYLKSSYAFVYRLKPMHPYAGIIRIRFSGIISAFKLS